MTNEKRLITNGKWIIHEDWNPNIRYGCNICGNLTKERAQYCPNCKAYMKGGANELHG